VTTRSGRPSEGRTLAPGRAGAAAVVLDTSLSLWGGMDPATGRVVDRHHPQSGISLRGAVVVMPGGRGSSSSSSVLAEAIRTGTAPAAFVLREADPILAVGAIVAAELYGRACPVVVAPPELYERIGSGDTVWVEAASNGARILVTPRGSRGSASR
jgi:predicted aconitase with swiveling domain